MFHEDDRAASFAGLMLVNGDDVVVVELTGRIKLSMSRILDQWYCEERRDRDTMSFHAVRILTRFADVPLPIPCS